MKKTISIVLADDHALIRAGYRSILEDVEEMELLGEAADGVEAIEKVAELMPDIVILDITMPNKNGLEAAKEISSRFKEVKILMLSMHKEEAYIKESIVNGAHGYLVKDADSDMFIKAIRELATGRRYYGEISSKILLDGYLNELTKAKGNQLPDNKNSYDLSNREKEVLSLVVKGKTSSEIAEELFLSSRTVENHRQHIMKKLDVRNTAELIQKAIRDSVV